MLPVHALLKQRNDSSFFRGDISPLFRGDISPLFRGDIYTAQGSLSSDYVVSLPMEQNFLDAPQLFAIEAFAMDLWKNMPKHYLRGRVSWAALLPFLVILGLLSAGIAAAVNPLERGLRVLFFQDAAWTDPPVFEAVERRIMLDRVPRVLLNQTTDYGVQWVGYLLVPESGEYEFTLVSDDGSSLFLDQELLIDNGGFHGKQERSGRRYLARGSHAIHLNYMQGQGMAIFRAFWTPPGGAPRSLSEAILTRAPVSWPQYWVGRGIEIFLACVALGLGALVLAAAFCAFGHHRPAALTFRVRHGGALVFLAVFVAHFGLSGMTTPWDSKWSVHTALSIVREGNTNIDEYFPITEQFRDHTVVEYFGHRYNLYPVGTALVAVPIVWLVDRFMEAGWMLDTEQFLNEYRLIPAGIEKFAASVIVAATAVLIYAIGMRLGYGHATSLSVTLIFAFGTSAWSTASRALWQHGPTMLMLALALYCWILADRVPRHAPRAIPGMALPLAFSFVIRPTNALSIAAFSLLVACRYRKYVLAYCLWGLTIAVAFGLYSASVYHLPIPPYYLDGGQLGGSLALFLEALAGSLISPSRGLLVFSPVLLFAVYGVVHVLRDTPQRPLGLTLLGVILLHWLVSALHPRWWGGHSYGPRYLSDMLPYLMVFLFPVFQALGRIRSARKAALAGLLTLTVAVSVFIHWRGATSEAVYGWNAGPVNVDDRPARIWDWRDPQFLRGLK